MGWKHRRDTDMTTEDGARVLRPRGWGPFTGRQLTTIIVAFALAAAVPGAAYAADNLIISGPDGNQANVTANNRLSVADGLPGIPRHTVLAVTRMAGQFFRMDGGVTDTQEVRSNEIDISSITIANGGLNRAVLSFQFEAGCSGHGDLILDNLGTYEAAPNVTVTIPFPTPLIESPLDSCSGRNSGPYLYAYMVVDPLTNPGGHVTVLFNYSHVPGAST